MPKDLVRDFEDSLITSKVASRFVEAKEFSTPREMEQYFKDHPNADKSKHHLKMLRDFAKKKEKKKAPYVPLMQRYQKKPKPEAKEPEGEKKEPEGEPKEASSFKMVASGMRDCSVMEYQQALAKAGWPEPRYMNSKRIMTKLFMDRGTEVAQWTEISSRGKKPQVSYMCNPEYLSSGTKGEYYVELDKSSGLYCVFNTEEGDFAFSSWSDEDDAERDAAKRNR
jgi:hypothetical protein